MTKKTETTYELIDVTTLKLADYQRSPQPSRIKKIVNNFDERKLGILKVSLRDGRFWCFDGQHRMLACKSYGHDFVMCEVHHGLTYEEEAMLFYSQSDCVVRVKVGEIFKGKIEAKDEKSIELKNVMEYYGFVPSYNGSKKFNGIAALGTIEKIERISGIENLRTTLFLIRQAWNGSPESTDARMLMGVSLFIRNNETFNEKTFVKKLSKVDPFTIMRRGDSDLANGEYKPYEIVIKEYYEKGNRKQ